MRTKIDPASVYFASFNRFELRLPGQCVIDCSHSGPCDDDVSHWAPKVRELNPDAPEPDKIRDELQEFGAWEPCELESDDDNWSRIIWIAACNVSEDESTLPRKESRAWMRASALTARSRISPRTFALYGDTPGKFATLTADAAYWITRASEHRNDSHKETTI